MESESECESGNEKLLKVRVNTFISRRFGNKKEIMKSESFNNKEKVNIQGVFIF